MLRRNIPNLLTLANLAGGCMAILFICEGSLISAGYCVAISLLFDFLDGFAARLLGVSSAIGKDLDSLADMVTFGVVPGLVMYSLLQVNCIDPQGENARIFGNARLDDLAEGPEPIAYLKYIALLIPLFSAWRLAKFNNDLRQSDSFIGVPTPANAIVICSLPFILRDSSGEMQAAEALRLCDPFLLAGLTLVMCVLMVSELPLFALKFKSFKWRGNEIRYVFLLVSLALIIWLGILSLPVIIGAFILLSIVNNIFSKHKQ